MYVRQTCNIELAGTYRLKGLHAVEIKKSVHQIVQTAKLLLPLSVVFRNGELLKRIKLIDKIKEGDPILIDLGYNGNNRREFTGFIRRINTKQPLEIEIEDQMYLMRKTYFKKSFKKASVKELLNYLLAGLFEKTGFKAELYNNVPELTITNFVMDGANGVAALQELSDQYGLASYFTEIDGKVILYCGLAYGLKKQRVKYELQRNTISVSDLKYQVSDDKSYQVKVIHHQPSGEVKNYEFGEKNGDSITLHINEDHSAAEIKELASVYLEKIKSQGYKGSFETFLLPNVEPGDIADITEKQFNRNGSYYVATVTTTFGSGARRKPEIDITL